VDSYPSIYRKEQYRWIESVYLELDLQIINPRKIEMSELKEALEFIAKWVQQNIPTHPAVMNQGLSREEINSKVKDLEFNLPEEIYELYQWRNGGKEPFIPHPDSVIFLLFMIEDGGYFTVCSEENSEVAPIYCNDIPEEVIGQEPRYSSLTSMMRELVEELKSRS
jgi:hypothetical protein